MEGQRRGSAEAFEGKTHQGRSSGFSCVSAVAASRASTLGQRVHQHMSPYDLSVYRCRYRQRLFTTHTCAAPEQAPMEQFMQPMPGESENDSRVDYEPGYTRHNSLNNRFYPPEPQPTMDSNIVVRNGFAYNTSHGTAIAASEMVYHAILSRQPGFWARDGWKVLVDRVQRCHGPLQQAFDSHSVLQPFDAHRRVTDPLVRHLITAGATQFCHQTLRSFVDDPKNTKVILDRISDGPQWCRMSIREV